MNILIIVNFELLNVIGNVVMLEAIEVLIHCKSCRSKGIRSAKYKPPLQNSIN